jgi:hypothetical protein
MMNKTLVEDRLVGSRKFSSGNSILQRNEDIKDESFLFISTLSGMHLYMLFVSFS